MRRAHPPYAIISGMSEARPTLRIFLFPTTLKWPTCKTSRLGNNLIRSYHTRKILQLFNPFHISRPRHKAGRATSFSRNSGIHGRAAFACDADPWFGAVRCRRCAPRRRMTSGSARLQRGLMVRRHESADGSLQAGEPPRLFGAREFALQGSWWLLFTSRRDCWNICLVNFGLFSFRSDTFESQLLNVIKCNWVMRRWLLLHNWMSK